TGHRLERHWTFAIADTEHMRAELLPVATLNPKLPRQELGSPDLRVAEPTHLAANVVFQDAIERMPSRMPEDHPWRILLDMPKIEACSETSMIQFVHSVLSWGSSEDGFAQKRRAPSVAGGALLVTRSVTARDQETTRRSWSSWWSWRRRTRCACAFFKASPLTRQPTS